MVVPLFWALALAGCASVAGPSRLAVSTSGNVHEVVRGETLWSISRGYGVELSELVRVNRISDASRIRVGQRLIIPGKRQPVEQRRQASALRPDTRGASLQGQFGWPVQGRVISVFGTRRYGTLNKGLDIQARRGASVRAAREGKISFVHEGLPGFGKTIIIDHEDGFASVYAYIGQILVQQGQWVKQRQVIARVGSTGRTEVPALHFEIRRNQKAQNPLYYLP